MKHNKKRNTAILYESLICELVKQTMKKNDKRRVVINIIKEFFNKNTELYKELQLYRSLYDNVEETASIDSKRLQEEVRSEYDNLNHDKIRKEKNRIIDCINKQQGSDVYNNFIPSYKHQATIHQWFNKPSNIKKRIVLENTILSSLSQHSNQSQEKIVKHDNVTLKSFNKLFEKKYNEKLNKYQKRLQSEYALSKDENDLSLKVFLNEEQKSLKKRIKKVMNEERYKEDEEMKAKYGQILEHLDSYKEKNIDRDIILKIMEMYEVLEEEEG